jgi:hypothetical protein
VVIIVRVPLPLLWRVRGEQVLWLDDRVTINIANLGQDAGEAQECDPYYGELTSQ